ncbi:MAG: 3-keto-5-aminohexanoate cleavage protein [Cohaesibacter sp.]|jgi:uncharacterized protein (DUF849 family)|nr:3-keto-5-aminohexanoate cleavage protein [Cohaesibacter sp.]
MILGLPRPAVLALSPNGPNASKLHHPQMPLTSDEQAQCAKRCLEAGASLYHLSAFDEKLRYSLEKDVVRQAMDATEEACEGRLLIQLNLKASDGVSFAQQRALTEQIKPQAVAIPFREIFPFGAEDEAENEARDFLDDCHKEAIAVRFDFSDEADLDWFYAYRQYGLIPGDKPFLHFSLEQATAKPDQTAHSLRPYLVRLDKLNMGGMVHWSASASGEAERSVAAAALAFGGHCQVGFAHNLHDLDGELAAGNAQQIEAIRPLADALGRPPASKFEALAMLKG